jgi:hypothetical protein
VKRQVLLFVLALLTPSIARPQTPATQPAATDVAVDPIRCWWRTASGGVRTGETFTLALTCAVLENDAVQVVPDESRLGVAVIQMAPFEIIGGTHPADLRTSQRRFFQYEYHLRIINPDAIGKDVRIPDLSIHYRVNSRVAANASLQGRDLVYILPPQSVRVASLVPSETADIRDASGESFGTAETLDFRAGVLEITAIALIALGSLMILLVLLRLARGSQRRTPADQRLVSPRGVTGLAVGELESVQREREQQGWTEALIEHALAATRITAAAALERKVSQRVVVRDEQAGEGRLMIRNRRLGKSRAISSSVTAATLASALSRRPDSDPSRPLLEELRSALVTFASRQYGRDATMDAAALDGALSSAIDAARQVRSRHAWFRNLLRRRDVGETTMESQA